MSYDPKTFHRNYEDSYGYLKAEELPPIDFAVKEQIEMLFPSYKRQQLAAAANKIKLTKLVDVPVFSLRTPDNSEDLFKNARLEIEPHKRCALFGINGSGKTSLFNAISSGEIREFPKHMHVHHMKELEHHESADALSVIDTVLCSHPYHRILRCVETVLKAQIESETDAQRLSNLKDNLSYIEQQMTSSGAYTAEKRGKAMLRVLGFDETGEAAPVSSLSGGLRMRVALASAFIIDPDVLLLDEPTNHL